MNTLRAIEYYHYWVLRLNIASSSSDQKSIQSLKQEYKELQQDLLTNLFAEIPTLNEFKISGLWYQKAQVISVNQISAVTNDSIQSEEYKSWLVEVNLKSSEMDLLNKTMPTFFGFFKELHENRYFKREDFLK